MALGGAAVHFRDWSAGDPILGRPFFNVVANQQFAEEVAYPGDIAGSVSVDARTSFAAAGADPRFSSPDATMLLLPVRSRLGGPQGLAGRPPARLSLPPA